MARRSIHLLTVKFIQTVTEAGKFADGGGLYLVTKSAGKRWIFSFTLAGRRREMGLGSFSNVSLSEARRLADEARQLIGQGIDPIEHRNAHSIRAASEENSDVLTFGQFAEICISQWEHEWRSAVHRRQWRASLEQHANILSDIPIAEITTDHILAVLEPIWAPMRETARRLRGRIESILDAAKARGMIDRDKQNPAAWSGHLEYIFKQSKSQARKSVKHHRAVPYDGELPKLMTNLSQRPSMSARALRFTILTAARTNEVLGSKWCEIEGNNWVVPDDRTKTAKTHTIPLSSAALTILNAIGRGEPNDYIFANAHGNRLSGMAMLVLLRRITGDNFTVHGFRSSFKDWATDSTDYAEELSEEALGHTIGDRTRNAYRRGAAIERRRQLMEDWALHLTAKPLPRLKVVA